MSVVFFRIDDRLIHGHTHRPARHLTALSDGRQAERIVLGDWYHQRSQLAVSRDGIALLPS